MKKVLIIQRVLPHYRIDFFNKLRTTLSANDLELTLIYGKDTKSLKKDEVDLEWAICIDNKEFQLGQTSFFWQPCLPYLSGQDLVIVEQANKNLINYLLLIRRLFSSQKIAFWGHGLNRQAQAYDFRNRFKKTFLTQCDWWFAYTSQVKEYLIAHHFPSARITTVQNAIDTTALARQYASLAGADLEPIKRELGITTDNIGLYVGGMYPEKRLGFLIEAGDLIKARVKDFQLIMIGSGVEAELVKEAARTRSWLHYLGPKFGYDKVPYFKLSKLFLMPGLVGLAVLDSFALQTPTVTTHYPFHSPEIEYLENGVNGIIAANTLQDYAQAVTDLLQNDAKRRQLVEGCKISATKYTIDQMVSNYAGGILKCLGMQWAVASVKVQAGV